MKFDLKYLILTNFRAYLISRFCHCFNLPRTPFHYKEPRNGKFDDCTTQVLPDLQAADNSESEEEC